MRENSGSVSAGVLSHKARKDRHIGIQTRRKLALDRLIAHLPPRGQDC
jgi:hypothetical protein